MNEAEYIPIDYKSFVAHIREVGVHEPRADHHDRHLGLPVFAKFYRMPDGTVFGAKEPFVRDINLSSGLTVSRV